MKRIRVSLSIKKDLIDKIDNFVDGTLINSRSNAIEQFLEKYLEENRCCVILAGGDPRYLWLDDIKEYRPLIKISDKETLIENILKKIIRFDYRNIIIVGSKIINTRIFELIGNGERLGCRIIYTEESEFKDSANSLKLAEKYLKSTFLFLPCDHYFDFDIKKLEQIHKLNNFVTTLAIYGGIRHDHNKSAIVELNGNEIINYWDTPKEDKTLLISTLIGFAEPGIFDFIKERVSLHSVLPQFIEKRELGGALLSGSFVNVHTKEDVNMVKRLVR